MLLCLQVYLKSHFAQPNSIEFSPAVLWKQQQQTIADVKELLRKEHAAQLKGIMLEYMKVCFCSIWMSEQISVAILLVAIFLSLSDPQDHCSAGTDMVY